MTTMVDYPPELGPRTDLREPEPEGFDWGSLFGKLLLMTAVFLLLFCSVVTTVGVVLIQDSQKDGRKLLDQVTSCTTPGMSCYERSQAQLGDTVSTVRANARAAAAAAVSCAISLQRRGEPVTYVTVTRCQTRTLAKSAQ